MEVLVFLLFIFYFLYTLSFAVTFNISDVYFTKQEKLIHNILIWVVPFIWIMVLKLHVKSGNRPRIKPFPSGTTLKSRAGVSGKRPIEGWWDSGIGSIFHNISSASSHQHSEYDSTGGYHGGHDHGGGADSTGFDGGDGGDGGD